MNTAIVIANILTVVRIFVGGAMCIFGYRWSRGLISTTSFYVGAFLGLYIVKNSIITNPEDLLLIPLLGIICSILSYLNAKFNHIIVGFLLPVKILLLIMLLFIDDISLSGDIIVTLKLIIIISVLVTIILNFIPKIKTDKNIKNYVVVLFLAFLGSVDLVQILSNIFNKVLFISTEDLSIYLNPINIVFKYIGIEQPSIGEVVGILFFTTLSFIWLNKRINEKNIDLSKQIIDDRKNSELINLFKNIHKNI